MRRGKTRTLEGTRERMAGDNKPYYDPAKFDKGALVRISDQAKLEEFSRTWQLHHKLEPGQLAYGGRQAAVKISFMYHGGDVLYELEGVPGIWHEHLLESV
jgi:hypothetical protein